MITYQLDTNVLLRYLTNDVPAETKKARKFLESVKKQNVHAEISEPVFVETVIMLRKYFKFPKIKVIELAKSLLALDWIFFENAKQLNEAIHLYATQPLDFVDCLIFVRAQTKHQAIFTFDKTLALVTAKSKSAN